MVGSERCGQKCEVRFCSYLNIYRFHSYQSFGIFTTRVSDAHCCSLEERIRNPCRHERSISFLKIKWGGGQSHPKILDNQTSNKKKKVRKKKRTSSQIMGWARKPTITSILMLISCFSFHFFTCSKKVGGRATPW